MTPFLLREEVPGAYQEALAGYSPLMQTLLYHRGIKTKEDAERFLAPDWDRDTHDPLLIHDMQRAVERIIRAIENNERIVVYGDYDTDGIPGSVVLHDFFKKIGYAHAHNYIPHRHKEGYGLNTDAVTQFHAEGTTLLITVDCGIADIDEVAHAQALGIDVIVTDHHLPGDTLPAAYAVVNSKKAEDAYPDDMLCGAAVAWKLVHALLKERGELWGVPPGWERWLLDMVGIATVADMVPLKKENRALAHYGLHVLRKSPRPGLTHLLRTTGIGKAHLTEDDIGFMIGPRINAASRMGIPMDAFRLLATDDEKEAGALAAHLEEINTQRKHLVAHIAKEAKKALRAREPREVIVLGNPAWKVGVLGIVANNLMEEFKRPVFLWGKEDMKEIKGSCRSDGSVNIVEMMRAVPEGIFLGVGGHEFSGGFSVSHDGIHTLEDVLVSAYARVGKRVEEVPPPVDAHLALADVSWALHDDIARLAPFGVDNPKPVFVVENAPIARVRVFGKQKNHLGLDLARPGAPAVSAIEFFSDHTERFEEGDRVSMLACLEKSMFRGRPELRLRIVKFLL